jgi:mersacidin/lichenicidin family type 2 lantibiotic
MEGQSQIPETPSVMPLMSNQDIVRAWKDAGFRRSLSAEQRQWLPGNPAGPADLSNDELKAAGGLALGEDAAITTAVTCTEYTFQQWKSCGCLPETTSIVCTEPIVCPA